MTVQISQTATLEGKPCLFVEIVAANPDALDAAITQAQNDLEAYRRNAPRENEIAKILSPREYEVAQLAIVGKRNQDIARELGVKVNTIETHLRKAYIKLGVNNRVALANLLKDTKR